MVRWDAEKNAFIMGTLLSELNVKMTDALANTIIAQWPTDTLGEAPTLRAIKDQVKKIAGGGSAGTGKKAAAGNKGNGKGKGKGKKRGRKESEDEQSADATQDDADDDEESPTKKVKAVVKEEQVESEAEV